jgi:uncharacterized protein (DUF1778 family)
MSERFPETMLLRLSTGLREAIERAAVAEHTKPTDYIRRALLERVRKDCRRSADDEARV